MPAYQAGLRNGDFILEINFTPVKTLEHKNVINLILLKDKEVDFLVDSKIQKVIK